MKTAEKIERARIEQEKALAHRRGISDAKAGLERSANPFMGEASDHRARAWDRAWAAEQALMRR